MNYTYFMLPLSILKGTERGVDEEGNFILAKDKKVYRLHVVGSVAALELNEESGSGYVVIDDTFSTVLAHFQKPLFNLFNDIVRGSLVEAIGSIDVYNESTTLYLNNIKKISLDRYCYNKLESIKNLKAIVV